MRPWLRLLALLVFLAPLSVLAQDKGEADTYKITDVKVDVTADTAAHARDQSILQAQRAAFTELVIRLGVEGKAPTPDDATLASLVQAFEVQSERTSSIRYIGVMTVQFKPAPTRAFLGKTGTNFTETRSRPNVLLPVALSLGRPILFEDRTAWRTAWDEAQHQTGLVTLAVPAGELDDVAAISGADALAGKAEALQAIMKKYQAAGVIVASLEVQAAGAAPRITLTRYDQNGGKSGEPTTLTLPPVADDKALMAELPEGVRQVRAEIEKGWRQTTKSLKGPAARLAFTAMVDSPGAWNAMKTKLSGVFGVAKVNVLSLSRAGTRAELDYHGDIQALQTAMAQEGLILEQRAEGWFLSQKQ